MTWTTGTEMSDETPTNELSPRAKRRLRIAIVLIVVGLLTELFALLAFTPTTFLLFVMVGCPLMAVGVVLYLVHVIRDARQQRLL